jgi:hypothetical protein
MVEMNEQMVNVPNPYLCPCHNGAVFPCQLFNQCYILSAITQYWYSRSVLSPSTEGIKNGPYTQGLSTRCKAHGKSSANALCIYTFKKHSNQLVS